METWTHNPPTCPGWYWTQNRERGHPVRVVWVDYDLYLVKGKQEKHLGLAATKTAERYLRDLHQPQRVWAGPIFEPVDL